jgi:hypothetical protein
LATRFYSGHPPLFSQDAFAVLGRINLAKLVKFFSLRIQLNQKYSDAVRGLFAVREIQILPPLSLWTS